MGLQNLNEDGVSLKKLETSCAELLDINLFQANLVCADLRNASLSGANLKNAKVTDYELNNAILEGDIIPNSSRDKSSATWSSSV